MLGYVSGKHTELAISDLARGAAVLTDNANRVLAFFNEAAFIEDKGTIGAAEVIIDKTTILFEHALVVPPRGSADKALQGPDVAVF